MIDKTITFAETSNFKQKYGIWFVYYKFYTENEIEYCWCAPIKCGDKPTLEEVTNKIREVYDDINVDEFINICSEVSDNYLDEYKYFMNHKIKQYDTNDVNEFTLNGDSMWFSKDIRVSLRNSINIEKEHNAKTTTIWYNGKSYVMDIDFALNMLDELEIYAIQCFNVTLNLINEVDSIDEVKIIDFNYPIKLNFNYGTESVSL